MLVFEIKGSEICDSLVDIMDNSIDKIDKMDNFVDAWIISLMHG